MSTSSLICVLLPNGSIKNIYCHSDGFPTGVGKILLSCYNTFAKAEKLINLGNISCLGKTIGKKHSFSNHFDSHETKNMCRAYGRDRGEKDQEFFISESINSIHDDAGYDSGIEWIYLFQPGIGWTFCKTKEPNFLPLTTESVKG